MSQRLKIAVVVTLVLANAALVILVRDKMADSRDEAAKATPAVAPTTTETPTPEPPPPGGPQNLTIADDDAIFRIHGGSCDGKESPAITVSTDNGATFDDVGLPEDIRTVFALTAKDADTLDLVAAPKSCKPQRFVSTDGGDIWEAAEGAEVWFLGPRARVTSPVGVVDPGCTENLSLSAPNPDTARVFCASGVLLASNDAGETWVQARSPRRRQGCGLRIGQAGIRTGARRRMRHGVVCDRGCRPNLDGSRMP